MRRWLSLMLRSLQRASLKRISQGKKRVHEKRNRNPRLSGKRKKGQLLQLLRKTWMSVSGTGCRAQRPRTLPLTCPGVPLCWMSLGVSTPMRTPSLWHCHFWEHFDKDGWSLWYAEYRFPEELTRTFMSCNLITGMFQRLGKLRKNAFASVILFGTNNSNSISGVWVFRGQGLAFPLSPDWQVDYESYTWRKLDPGIEETQTLVPEYFSWEGTFQYVGKAIKQGKIFK